MSEKGDRRPRLSSRAAAGQERTVFLRISGHYDIHVPAEGEPQEALLQRVLFEPGYTLRFAFERHLGRVARSEPPATPAASP
jgi:hypothetical protein